MGELNVVGVGAGYFSQFHYAAWARSPGARLSAIADRDLAAAERQAARLAEAPRLYDRVERMLAAERPDLVDIITPPPTHLAMIEAAFAAGARAAICQKPFCGGLEAATRAAALAEGAGRSLIVHENFRFQPWWRAIKSALEEGAIGAVHQAAFRLRPGDGQGPDAYLGRQPYFREMPRFLIHETGVHWIDLFVDLLGAPKAVFADLRRLNPAIAGEDAGHVLFFYDDGRRALFDGDRLLDHAATDRRRTMGEALIEGAEGTLRLDGDGRLWRRDRGRAQETELSVGGVEEGFGGGCVSALQRHVIAHLLDGTPLENEAAAYLDVLRIEEAIYRSAACGAKEPL